MPHAPLKKRPNFEKVADVSKSSTVKKKKPKLKSSWVAVGIDLSTTSIAGCAFGYDHTLRKEVGPVFSTIRWERHQDYFIRMGDLARGHEFILDLIGQMRLLVEPDSIHIAIEEPWPFGMQKRLESNSLKQQAQMSGCFIGSLLRWGYVYVHEIHNQWWKKVVAEDLGISVHWSKYGKGIEGKMRAKEWAIVKYPDVPNWPDLIQHSKRGLIPRPDNSKARAQQPDDRYDALAIATWMRQELDKYPRDDTIRS